MFIRWIILLKISNLNSTAFCATCAKILNQLLPVPVPGILDITDLKPPYSYCYLSINESVSVTYFKRRFWQTKTLSCCCRYKDLRLKHWTLLVLQMLIRRLRVSCFNFFAEKRFRTASRSLNLYLRNNIANGAVHEPAHMICSQNIVQFYGTTVKGIRLRP
jgi:hypothetical protein